MTLRRGYTLLEALLVVVVIGVLGGLAVSSYDRMRTNATFSTSINELLADLSNARSKARGEEQPTVVVFLASSMNTAASRSVILQDNNRAFDLSNYVPDELPSGPKLVNDVTFSALGFDTPLTKTRAAFPEPFSAAATRGGIRFAKTGFAAPHDLRGTVTFQTDGRASFSDGATTGSVYLVESASTRRDFTVGMIGATGIIKGF